MSLASLGFLGFLALVGLVYFCAPRPWGTALLLLASYGFYALWQPRFCLLLLAATAVSWLCGRAWDRRWLGLGRAWLTLGALYLFAALFLYKYLDFSASLLLRLFGRDGDFHSGLLLPVGISFYTFSAAAYLFELGRGAIRPEESLLRYGLYVAFFPSLLSGPINRPQALLPQIREPKPFCLTRAKRGLLRYGVGAVKKQVLANTLGLLVDRALTGMDDCPGALLALAAMAYSLQLYFDFSGYTDMALGAGELLGFSLPENFRAPYLARTVRDFWRRWHISLTSWLRDYLYIPLGGSRRSRARVCFNLLLVFALSGLWHGADGSFLLWGGLNGLLQVLSLLSEKPRRRLSLALGLEGTGLAAALQWARTFLLMSLCWIFFRADSSAQALRWLGRIFTAFPGGTLGLWDLIGKRQLLLCLLLLAVFAADALRRERGRGGLLTGLEERAAPYWLTLSALACFTAVFGVYGRGFDAGSFVYFKF